MNLSLPCKTIWMKYVKSLMYGLTKFSKCTNVPILSLRVLRISLNYSFYHSFYGKAHKIQEGKKIKTM